MFPFRKPPTKFEVAKKGVSDAVHHLIDAVPTEQIEEKLDELKKGAVLSALAVAEAAHHAGESAAHKLEELQAAAAHFSESVSNAAHGITHSAGATAQDAAQSAQSATSAATQAAQSVAKNAAQSVQDAVQSAAQSAQGIAQNAQSAAKNVQNAGQTAAQTTAALAAAKASAVVSGARETGHHVVDSAQSARGALGEKTKTATDFATHLKERAATDFKIGGQEAQNAKIAAQKAAQREAEALKARLEAADAKKQAKNLGKIADAAQKEADLSASQAKQAAISAAAEAKATLLENAAQIQAKVEAKAAEVKKAAVEKAAEIKTAHEQKKAQAVAAQEKLDTAANIAQEKISDKQEEAKVKSHDLVEKAQSQAARVTGDLAIRRDESGELAEIQIIDTASKWGWILFGLAVGAVLALLFAPTSGRRSRAAIRDRLGKVSDGAVDAATATSDKVVDIAQRVEGLANKVEAKLAADSEGDDDITVADRVRSMLGHHEIAKNLERLNIDCAEGVVTLRGPALHEGTQTALIAAIKAVPGVREVTTDFVTE